MAEKLRSKVAALKIPHKESKAGDHVTISLGLATSIPHKDSAPESLISAADKALYEAKEGGRNRVVTSGVIDSNPP
jgi:diguanylate cyclase (GGDEF)-like protein